MANLCEGRVAIVTGAARGVGKENALLLAKEGAKVVVNDLGGEAVVNGDDVSSWNGAKNMIDQAVDTYGKLDILVNNAGILRDRMLVNMTEEEWDSVIQVHLKGTFAPARHAAAYWRGVSKETDGPVGGRIINTTSTSGIYGNVGQTNYGAAKAGIAAFTIIAARELRRIGVTVNAISPSAYTRMTDSLREYTEEDIAVRHPRWVSPTVVYLASSDAHDISGRIIQAGAGMVAEVDQVADPSELGPLIREMCEKARKNSGMDGMELD